MNTKAPITETTLRAAAQVCVGTDHAVAAVLFGSRARGTAGTLSDWDVCLITDDGDLDETTRQARLEAEQPLWGNSGIEVVWRDRSVFASGVPIGSLEANIVRDGRMLAGDGAMAKARRVPFDANTVQSNIGRAGYRLHEAMVAAGRSGPNLEDGRPEQEHIGMVTDSIAGAEALGRALCALTETEHTGDHRIGKAGRQIGDRGGEGALPLEKHLMDAISEKVQQLDDSVQTVRKIEYGEPGEPEEKTITRFIHALEADLWLRQGLLHGEGPWADLKGHARRTELREELARATKHEAGKNRDHWSAARHGVVSPRLREAIGRWVSGLNLLAQRERIAAQPGERRHGAKELSEAARIHSARTRHEEPRVRANAFRNLTALEATSEKALEALLTAMESDPAIVGYPAITDRLREYTGARRRSGAPPGRDDAVSAAQTPEAAMEAKEVEEKETHEQGKPPGERDIQVAADGKGRS